MLWHESGGTGPRTILLLHGLGATSAVWNNVRNELNQRGTGQWIAPDLSGHGLSSWQPHYSIGHLAADLAGLIQNAKPLFIVGHSLGAYVGLALASRWFGAAVAGVLGVGPKITWTDADLQGARDFAARPPRWYATHDEAVARYRRVSGLAPEIAVSDEWLARGVVQGTEGWRLSQDPRTFLAAGAPFASLVASADARVMLARGEQDALVSAKELQLHAANAVEIAHAGHNAHVEKPSEIVALLEQLIALA